jgi:hypothetical protein
MSLQCSVSKKYRYSKNDSKMQKDEYKLTLLSLAMLLTKNQNHEYVFYKSHSLHHFCHKNDIILLNSMIIKHS